MVEFVEENHNSPDDSFSHDESVHDNEPIDVPKKRKRYNKFQNVNPDHQNVEREPVLTDGEDSGEEGDFGLPVDEDSLEKDDSENDDQILNDEDDDYVPAVEQFTAPGLEESFDFEQGTNKTDRNSWILLWIFKFQSRFRLPDTAIESLIEFTRMILTDANYEKFKDFPTSAYTAKKLLGIGKQDKTYAVCPDCNALYNIEEILTQNQSNQFKCTHVEFSDHPMRNRREPCNTELLIKVPINDRFINRPKMTFPMPSLKSQLITMYQRPGFEESLQKWANRNSEDGLYTDIYDGKIWKTFPSSLDDQDSQFFIPETADSNLGLMINLDWFQPFESSVYISNGAEHEFY